MLRKKAFVESETIALWERDRMSAGLVGCRRENPRPWGEIAVKIWNPSESVETLALRERVG